MEKYLVVTNTIMLAMNGYALRQRAWSARVARRKWMKAINS